MPELSTVIVTGGGSGIGRATARLFAEHGADVLVVGRTEASLAQVAAECPGIRTFVADVGAPGSAEKIVAAALERHGRIDVLVNNAAITRPAALGEIDRKLAEDQLATNLLGPIFLTQEAVPHMPPGSAVVNVSSNPQYRGWPRNSVYGGSKVALDFLTHTWAVELAPRRIRVASVAPGPTDTPVLLNAGLTPGQIEERKKGHRIPAGRLGRPEEIAWWIRNVTLSEGAFLTGAVIRVDGGIGVS